MKRKLTDDEKAKACADAFKPFNFPIDMRSPAEKDLDYLCENHETHCWHETTEGDDRRIVQECCLCRECPCDRAKKGE